MAAPPDVIVIALTDLDDLFTAPTVDLLNEDRDERSGIDRILAELRQRRGAKPVPIRIELPGDQLRPGADALVTRAVRRWCDRHIATNRASRRTARLDGWSSLKIGLPMTILGFALVGTSSEAAVGVQEIDDVLLEHLGWVISWVGLWFPVDALIFGPLLFGRENHAWKRLREADITVVAADSSDLAPA